MIFITKTLVPGKEAHGDIVKRNEGENSGMVSRVNESHSKGIPIKLLSRNPGGQENTECLF